MKKLQKNRLTNQIKKTNTAIIWVFAVGTNLTVVVTRVLQYGHVSGWGDLEKAVTTPGSEIKEKNLLVFFILWKWIFHC